MTPTQRAEAIEAKAIASRMLQSLTDSLGDQFTMDNILNAVSLVLTACIATGEPRISVDETFRQLRSKVDAVAARARAQGKFPS